MFSAKRVLFFFVTVFMLTAQGCKSKFEKIRLSSDIAKKYQEAVKYYDKKDYNKALILLDDLVQRYRGRAEAEDLYYYFAYTNYNLKDYTTARYHFKIFADTYPNSTKAEECRYMAAYCFYLESPNYSLDQSNTIKAIEALQLFINLYPRSDRSAEAAKLIQDLRDKLEIKSFENAKLYLTIGDYKSAVIAFRNSMREYPDTKFAEEMEYLAIQSQYLYAKNSIEAKQEERFTEAIQMANEFAENYPESKFLKDSEQLKKDALKGIEEAKKILAIQAAEQKIKN
jgi:outer membrane protein assembly factor BamD